MRSGLLPPVGQADLSDNPPPEQAPPGWHYALVPNFSEWLAGDVVLVQGSWGISAAQLTSLTRANRQGRAFTHAGIYAGGGELIDAMPNGGIAVRQIWTYAQKRTLALRRLPTLSDQEGVRGAMEQKTSLTVFEETFVLSNTAQAAAVQWIEIETGSKNWSDKSKFELARRRRVF